MLMQLCPLFMGLESEPLALAPGTLGFEAGLPSVPEAEQARARKFKVTSCHSENCDSQFNSQYDSFPSPSCQHDFGAWAGAAPATSTVFAYLGVGSAAPETKPHLRKKQSPLTRSSNTGLESRPWLTGLDGLDFQNRFI